MNHLRAVYRLQKKGVVQRWLFLPGPFLWEQLLVWFFFFLILDIDSVRESEGTYSERKEQRPAGDAVYRPQGAGESQCWLLFLRSVWKKLLAV